MTTAGARTSVGQLPNFLVIGAMKAGTSSLYQYLRAHPQIFMPAAKELSFFAYEPNLYANAWVNSAPYNRICAE